jgi:hypothetical protein
VNYLEAIWQKLSCWCCSAQKLSSTKIVLFRFNVQMFENLKLWFLECEKRNKQTKSNHTNDDEDIHFALDQHA